MGSCEMNQTSKGTDAKGETVVPLSENQPIADTLASRNSLGETWCRQVVETGVSTVYAGKAFLDTCTCNMEEKYVQQAQKLCECVNNLGQVSLICDSISVSIERLYSSQEKIVIQNILEIMNCMN